MPSQLSCLNCWTFNVHLNPVHIHEEEEEEEETGPAKLCTLQLVLYVFCPTLTLFSLHHGLREACSHQLPTRVAPAEVAAGRESLGFMQAAVVSYVITELKNSIYVVFLELSVCH